METPKCKITRKKRYVQAFEKNQVSTNSPDVVQDGMNLEI
jgi:hypothetical protein